MSEITITISVRMHVGEEPEEFTVTLPSTGTYRKARDGIHVKLDSGLEAIRAEEREACAKIAHHYWVRWDHPTNMKCADTIEKAIRARGDGGENAGD